MPVRVDVNGPAAVYAVTTTPFDVGGRLDEQALRAHLRRLARAGLGVYLGSPGVGEGHVLQPGELERLYQVGAEELKGQVRVYAAGFEPRCAKDLEEIFAMARAAQLDGIQIYGVDGGHGMRPLPRELEQYFDDAIAAADMPVLLSTHPGIGYQIPVLLLEALVKRHPNVIGINGQQPSVEYLVRLLDAVGPLGVKVYAGGFSGILTNLALGGSGCIALETNLVPSLCNSVATEFGSGDLAIAMRSFKTVVRLGTVLDRFPPVRVRALKLAMKILKLPGGGHIRPPYLLPGPGEEESLARELSALGLTPGSNLLN